MDYRSIGDPATVKPGHLSISWALEIISLLPLTHPTKPEILLPQLMLAGHVRAVLIDANTGDECAIVSTFWQSEPAGEAFRALKISAPVHWAGRTVQRTGWVVLNAAHLQRALAPYIATHIDARLVYRSPDGARHFGVTLTEAASRTAFDEAVRRCRAARIAGAAPEQVTVPAHELRKETGAEHFAFRAETRARATGLGPAPEPKSPKPSARPSKTANDDEQRDFLTELNRQYNGKGEAPGEREVTRLGKEKFGKTRWTKRMSAARNEWAEDAPRYPNLYCITRGPRQQPKS